ncbi:helix-turn-helix domain-containing protein [Enterococcus sp. 5H]|uniref:helix-turn-helix domain-containing protein n=1 Tax=Enterococcus sp. 5H TaxID=1229490 RepID=UPI002302617D|nr:helix-turn-helix transcriptional regulator [Enterococcus sp. 5H]MDA9472656.1 hypothetical protein [Enterococcus sp. 5H]
MHESEERPINDVIVENIKRYWDPSKMTKDQFGKYLGTSGSEINRILGGGNITVKKLQQIAQVLEVKTIDLVEDWKEVK